MKGGGLVRRKLSQHLGQLLLIALGLVFFEWMYQFEHIRATLIYVFVVTLVFVTRR